MQPKLFAKMSNTKSLYFVGVLTSCTSCTVKEVRNGEYTLDLSTTINDECADLILSQKYISAKPNPTDNEQYFEIQKTERYIDGTIKVEAKHLSNLLFTMGTEGDINTEGIENSISGTPKQVWNKIISDYATAELDFDFESDITTSGKFSLGLSTPELLGNILCGAEGSFVDTWGGELKYDGKLVQLLKSRGKKSDYIIRYGQNISSAVQTESIEGTYSHILPYGKVSNGTNTINFFAPAIQIENTERENYRLYMLNCDDLLGNYVVGTKGENYATVRAAMTAYAKAYVANNNIGKCAISITVDLRTELDEMSQLGLCDTVTVVLDNYNTTATAKITEAEYDVLLERWSKIVIGTPTVTFADLILNKRRYLP